MSRPLRYQPKEWSTFFVTARCIHSRFLLRPSPRVNKIIIGVFARAVERFDIKLYGLCFLSNHYHLLLSSRNAASLAVFMQYIGSNIAREIGREHEWKEKFWSRRYYASIVLDEAAAEERMKYILANSVKEGLVKHPRYWPGVHCYRHLAEGTALHGVWIDRTKLYNQPHLHERGAIQHHTLKLHRLPGYESDSESDYRQLIRDLTDEAIDETMTETPVIGAKRILAIDPHSLPQKSDKGAAPLCHSTCHERRTEFIRAFKSFVDGYKQAFRNALQLTLLEHVPEGGLPPIGWHRLIHCS